MKHNSYTTVKTANKQYGTKQLTKAASYRKKSIFHSSIDDFLKQFPVSSLNEYGDRVIRGIRVC